MTKYLILNFRNAGLFRKHGRTKDKIYDINGSRDRKNELEFIEPITVHQISNMLHVLFGERPKPVNRITLYDKVDYLYKKALESYLKIDSYKNTKDKFYTETVQLNKPFYNSWNPVSYMNWNRVEKLLESELYGVFIKTLTDILGFDVTSKSFDEIKGIILETKDKRLDDLFDMIKSNKKTPIYSSIYGANNTLSEINKNGRTMITQTIGLDRLCRLSGQIIVPISDEDIKKLNQSKGCATILDGGLVYIKGVKSGNSLSVNGFTKVSEISLEKQ